MSELDAVRATLPQAVRAAERLLDGRSIRSAHLPLLELLDELLVAFRKVAPEISVQEEQTLRALHVRVHRLLKAVE